jgi:hypothetical protein
MRAWTSDAVPILQEFLSPGAKNGAKRRIWLSHADGLPAALRPALVLLFLFAALTALIADRQISIMSDIGDFPHQTIV